MSPVVRSLLLGTLLGACATADPATAAEPDVYAGKSVSVVIGHPPAGGFDSSARILMRHMNRHLPGQPNMIPKNMPGAGSLVATNYLFNLAPKEGTEFGIIGGSVPFGPLWSRDGVKFEAPRFNWIGSMDRWTGVALMWRDAPFTRLEDARVREVTVGATVSGDVTSIYPRVLNALLHTKFKVVGGYQGTSDLSLAMERGEIYGCLGWCWECFKSEKPDRIAQRKVTVRLA